MFLERNDYTHKLNWVRPCVIPIVLLGVNVPNRSESRESHLVTDNLNDGKSIGFQQSFQSCTNLSLHIRRHVTRRVSGIAILNFVLPILSDCLRKTLLHILPGFHYLTTLASFCSLRATRNARLCALQGPAEHSKIRQCQMMQWRWVEGKS